MKPVQKSQPPVLKDSPQVADMFDMPHFASSAKRNISLEGLSVTGLVAEEVSGRWGRRNTLVHDLLRGLCEFEGGGPHTIDHVDCPACQQFDELMKADLPGMAGQTFPEAANKTGSSPGSAGLPYSYIDSCSDVAHDLERKQDLDCRFPSSVICLSSEAGLLSDLPDSFPFSGTDSMNLRPSSSTFETPAILLVIV